MIIVFIRERRRFGHRHKRKPCKNEAEIRVIAVTNQGSLEPPETKRRKDPSLEYSEGAVPSQHLDFRLTVSRTVRK